MKDEDKSGATIRDELAARMQTTMTNLDYHHVVAAEALAFDRAN